MIVVKRTRIPKILEKKADSWLANLNEAFLEFDKLQRDPLATDKQKQVAKKELETRQCKYNHKEVKSALVEMFHGKCAYCESKITIVTYGHIEHFCPKSLPTFINKTFDWNNLLLSCDVCNNPQYKGTKFPLDSSDQPLLIDPTVSNPDDHFRLVLDDVAGALIDGTDLKGQISQLPPPKAVA